MKPTLSCNAQCRHCYHKPSECSDLVMSNEILEKTIRMVREEYDSAWYIWHGGEPLLAGEQFFKKVTSLQKKYYVDSMNRCGNTIQTNGTLLKSRFIEFCRENRINLGVSYECGFDKGLRPDIDGKKIESVLDYMSKKNHMFSVTATVHGGNVSDMLDMYQKFRSKGISFCYSPVLKMGCGLDNEDTYLDPNEYSKNLIEVFDTWITDVSTPITVLPLMQYFNSFLSAPNVSDCAHSSCLTKWICVYPNGDVYPCGKPCPEEFRMGNINDMEHISEVFESDGFRNILIGSIERRKKCSTCDIFDKCQGGCSIDALIDGNIEENGGFSCVTYKEIYSHIRDTVTDIMDNKRDLSKYNRFVKDGIIGKLTNPNVISPM